MDDTDKNVSLFKRKVWKTVSVAEVLYITFFVFVVAISIVLYFNNDNGDIMLHKLYSKLVNLFKFLGENYG